MDFDTTDYNAAFRAAAAKGDVSGMEKMLPLLAHVDVAEKVSTPALPA